MSTVSMLYKRRCKINDNISIVVPTLGEILEFGEDEYYGLVSCMTAMPIDMMVQLDDIGVDFTKINDYDLFLMLFQGLKTQDTHLLFGDLDLSGFQVGANPKNGMLVLYDEQSGIMIDRGIQGQIARTVRRIHHMKVDKRKPANTEAKDYMLERARIKAKRRKSINQVSQIEQFIVALVNTEQFKYDYESVLDLTIYQFNESITQIVSKIDYDNRMHGVYAGTIDAKKLSQEDLNWLTHK